MKERVLFVTQTLGDKAACGVGLYGKLWTDTLVHMTQYDFSVLYTDSVVETIDKIKELQPRVVFYLWHPNTSGWMSDDRIRDSFPNIKHVAVHNDLGQHMIDEFDADTHSGGFEYLVAVNPLLKGTDKIFTVNKLLPPGPTIPFVEPELPTIGFQGFGFGHKGILRLAQLVNEEFDEAIFRLHMPYSYFEDRHGHQTERRKFEVDAMITKPGIKVEFSHDLKDTQELINWMSQNSINCYLYDVPQFAGLASAPDYGLACRRPMVVSNNHMMMHFFQCKPSVVIDHSSLRKIIANGTAPLEPLYKAYSPENFTQDWVNVIDRLVQ